MPDFARLAATAVVLVALLAAPLRADEPRAVEVGKPAVASFEKAMPLLADAQRTFAAKDWDAAVAAYAKAAAALGDEPVLGGWRDQANYNAACAHARAGRAAEAAALFAKSVAEGFRPIVGPTQTGAWIEAPGLTLEHLLADPDLDPIRDEKAYVGALAPYLAAGAPVVEFTGTDAATPSPAVIVLAAEGADAERALPAWRVAAKDRNVTLVALAGPIRATPAQRRWILADGDERWAVAKVREALDLLAKDARVDPKRIFVAGVGERPGEAAWAAALAAPERVAGVAAPGARFHAAWHADAIATLPKQWRAALGPSDAQPAKMLKERGVAVATVEPSNDESKVTAAILDAMLGTP